MIVSDRAAKRSRLSCGGCALGRAVAQPSASPALASALNRATLCVMGVPLVLLVLVAKVTAMVGPALQSLALFGVVMILALLFRLLRPWLEAPLRKLSQADRLHPGSELLPVPPVT